MTLFSLRVQKMNLYPQILHDGESLIDLPHYSRLESALISMKDKIPGWLHPPYRGDWKVLSHFLTCGFNSAN